VPTAIDPAVAYSELAAALDAVPKGMKGLPTAIGNSGRGFELLAAFKEQRGSTGTRAALDEAERRFKGLATKISGLNAAELSALADSMDVVATTRVLRYGTAYFDPKQRTSELDATPETDLEIILNTLGQNLNNFFQLAKGRKLERASAAFQKCVFTLDSFEEELRRSSMPKSQVV